MKCGLNLYSLRKLMQTEKEFLSVMQKLKKIGYDYVQFSGVFFAPDVIRRVSEQSGLPVVLTHMPMDRILHDTQRLMEDHAVFGCKNIGLGMMSVEIILDEKKCKETIAALNESGRKMEESGFRFFYHHHFFEFFKHGEETVFDYMIRTAPYINFTADTYWLQYGGVNVTEFIKKLSGRMECVHLKDYRIERKETSVHKCEPNFAPVGYGVMDFTSIVEAMKASGVQYYLVEQDDACDLPDPFGEVEKSCKFIREQL